MKIHKLFPILLAALISVFLFNACRVILLPSYDASIYAQIETT